MVNALLLAQDHHRRQARPPRPLPRCSIARCRRRRGGSPSQAPAAAATAPQAAVRAARRRAPGRCGPARSGLAPQGLGRQGLGPWPTRRWGARWATRGGCWPRSWPRCTTSAATSPKARPRHPKPSLHRVCHGDVHTLQVCELIHGNKVQSGSRQLTLADKGEAGSLAAAA